MSDHSIIDTDRVAGKGNVLRCASAHIAVKLSFSSASWLKYEEWQATLT
jgi:hypothetical protein